MNSEARGKVPIVCRWNSASLDVPKNGHSRFNVRFLFQKIPDNIPDSAEAARFRRIVHDFFDSNIAVFGEGAFRDHDNAEIFSG